MFSLLAMSVGQELGKNRKIELYSVRKETMFISTSFDQQLAVDFVRSDDRLIDPDIDCWSSLRQNIKVNGLRLLKLFYKN